MQLVPRRELEDWFFRRAKPERHELEARARAEVAEWRWFKGLGNPLDPEPMRWQRAGIAVARLVKQVPTKDARAGHHEVGLDRTGRPWICYQHAVTERPYLIIWLHEPGWIRGVRYGTNIEYDFSGPEVVSLFELDDHGRVIGRTSYANHHMWPEDRALTEDDIERLRTPRYDVYFLREQYRWDGDRLIAADQRSADDSRWIPTTEIEWPAEKRKAPKVWRLLADGKRELRKARR